MGTGAAAVPGDEQLLAMLREDPPRAWGPFVERYADVVLSQLRGMGFDHDEAMDRFVYVFEKLAEDGCRRLRTIRHAGSRGELTPWIRAVVRNLSVSWAWSVEGRRRLSRPVARLPPLARRVFQLHFWQGLSASDMLERLRQEGHEGVDLPDVLDAHESVLHALPPGTIWGLLASMARRRTPISLDAPAPGTELPLEIPSEGEDPLARSLADEAERTLAGALEGLADRERLVVTLRYQDDLPVDAIAAITGLAPDGVRSMLKTAMRRLRRELA